MNPCAARLLSLLIPHSATRKQFRHFLLHLHIPRTYIFDREKHTDNFLNIDNTYQQNHFTAPKVIYCFWTGDNPLTENRIKGLETIQANTGVELKLITKDNLAQYIVEKYPLHHAFEYLSCVHKADYLRCYFMHHHGGGYTDIKPHMHNWSHVFDNLNQSNAYIAGYPEIALYGKTPHQGQLDHDLKKYWPNLIGNCTYIAKPYTPFTTDWYVELHKRMDGYAPMLQKYPGNIWGDNEGYPIPWANILGNIFHPLCLKYQNKLLRSKQLLPIVKDYR